MAFGGAKRAHMHLILIPAIASVVALGLLVLTVGAASLLMLAPSFAAAERALRHRATTSLIAALVFAWLGVALAMPLWGLIGDWAAIALLWANSPLGFVIGLVWSPRARQHEAAVRERRLIRRYS